MQGKKLTALGIAFTVGGLQAGSAWLKGELVKLDMPLTSVALSSAGTDTGIVLRDVQIADTMLDLMRSLPPPDIPGVTKRPAFRDTGYEPSDTA